MQNPYLINLFSKSIPFLLIIFIAGCNPNAKIKRQDNKEVIRNIFENWKQEQLKSHKYWAHDSCNSEWMFKYSPSIDWDKTPFGPFGFYDDSSSYKFVFADLNQDSIADGSITFQPKLCDYGTGGKWIFKSVLITSADSGYILNDSINFSLFNDARVDSAAFIKVDSIAANKIFITTINYQEIQLSTAKNFYRMEFDYKRKKLIQLIDSVAVF